MDYKKTIGDAVYKAIENHFIIGNDYTSKELRDEFIKHLKVELPEFRVLQAAIIETPDEYSENYSAYVKLVDLNNNNYKAGIYVGDTGIEVNVDEVK
jgi:ribose 5-phosphate isomerase RpiB|nr:MAG TPA: hypothetical protein [Caudoviricetes sp.]DAK33678.1 MAG TPA: hypothetical protein [Caudoviricetes sp.]